jgi:hypothetical protein
MLVKMLKSRNSALNKVRYERIGKCSEIRHTPYPNRYMVLNKKDGKRV